MSSPDASRLVRVRLQILAAFAVATGLGRLPHGMSEAIGAGEAEPAGRSPSTLRHNAACRTIGRSGRTLLAGLVTFAMACGQSTSPEPLSLRENEPSVGGLYPNRPISFKDSTEIDFSQAVPSLPDNVDRPIAGAPGWNMIFFDGNWSKTSDANAPQSAPGIWQGHWAPGSYGGGTIGQGSGHGIGNIFTYAPSGTSHLYMSLRVYFDFDASRWHPISNKFVNLEGDRSQILMQLREGDNWRHAEELSSSGDIFVDGGTDAAGEDHIPGQVDNRVIPNRKWTQIELLIDIPNHVYKIWQDGVLTTNASPNFVSTKINTVGIYAFRGGGGETITTDLYYKYDHFLVAW